MRALTRVTGVGMTLSVLSWRPRRHLRCRGGRWRALGTQRATYAVGALAGFLVAVVPA